MTMSALISDDDFSAAVEAAQCLETDEPTSRGNYKIHYDVMLRWFADIKSEDWTADRVIQASLMVYGWMPTILEGRKLPCQYTRDRASGFGLRLGMANNDPSTLPEEDYCFVNGSYVGTSKFLHLWKPDYFAIWDSRVACALAGRPVASRLIERADLVLAYQVAMRRYCGGSPTRNIRDVETTLFRFGQYLTQQR